jgi:hypothetical protein
MDAQILAPRHLSIPPAEVSSGLLDRPAIVQQQNANGRYHTASVNARLAMNERRFRTRFEHAQ